jgi:hypothetical protein
LLAWPFGHAMTPSYWGPRQSPQLGRKVLESVGTSTISRASTIHSTIDTLK